MGKQHTTRTLALQSANDDYSRFNLEAEGRGVLLRVESESDVPAADAFRLRDCWNACANLTDPTAAIEAARAAMRDTLAELDEAGESGPESGGDYPHVERMRAALALLEGK